MSDLADPRPAATDLDPRGRRIAELAGWLGTPLPPLDGPLLAFQADGRGDRAPVFLAGDLHAAHPRTGRPAVATARDPSLDSAIVTLADNENLMLDLPAVEGVWGVRIEGERLAAAPFFSVTDSDGRIRAWFCLPPPRLMIGSAQFWFPSVPPPRDLRLRSEWAGPHQRA